MPPRLVVEFTKMHGAANDFLVLDNRFLHFQEDELRGIARRMCPRRTGIGADGLLVFEPPPDDAHHYRMTYLNADGSRATMCGNGARCLARFARSAGLGPAATDEAADFVFATDAGTYRAHVPADPFAPVTLHVPPARAFAPELPLKAAAPPGLPSLAYVHTGTPHTVAFVDAAEAAPLERWGPAVRHDAAVQPEGANLNVASVLGPGALRVRTFEKGVEAETMACGTGVLAAAVAARRLGHVTTDTVTVTTHGGTLTVGFPEDEEDATSGLTLAGPVMTVCRGTFEL